MMTRSSAGGTPATIVDGRGRSRVARVPPDEQLVQHETERVDVGPLRERSAAGQLLRHHVSGSTHAGVRAMLVAHHRDAEVADANQSVLVDEDVRRFQIAVEDALRVRRRERVAQLPPDVGDLLGRQAANAVDERVEILALDQFHRQEEVPALFADVEDATDRRMRDPPRQPNFVEKKDLPGRRRRPHDLQRDGHAEDEIVGAPHVAHPAVAQTRNHPVASGEHLACREGVHFRSGRRRLALGVLVRGEQRPDVGAKPRVVGARLLDERLAIGRRPADRGEKDLFQADMRRRHVARV
jgi:hypothetical protein